MLTEPAIYKEILGISPFAIFVADESERLLYTNIAAKKLCPPDTEIHQLSDVFTGFIELIRSKSFMLRDDNLVSFEIYCDHSHKKFDCRMAKSNKHLLIFLQPAACEKNNNGVRGDYQQLLHIIDGIVWTFDYSQNRFLEVSPQVEDLLGYPMEEWTDQPGFWENHLHPEDREWAEAFCSTSLQTLDKYEFCYRMIAKDGSTVWLRDIIQVQVQESTDRNILKGMMIDVSREKKVIEELVQMNERFTTIKKLTNDLIWDWNLSTDIMAWSDNFYDVLGYEHPDEDDTRSNWAERVHIDDRKSVDKLVQKVLREKIPFWSTELKFLKADDSALDMYVRGYLFLDDHGSPLRMLGTMVDITERKKAEQELSNAYKKNRELSKHLQHAREEERKAIAREIHDELGQHLTVMKLELTVLKSMLNKEELRTVEDKLHDLQSRLSDTIHSIRRIASELRPSMIDDLGIVAALEWHANEFTNATGIKTYFVTSVPDIKPSDLVNISLFRILQESLTNVGRHAAANHIDISLYIENGELIMDIHDDGIGYDMKKKMMKAWGISGMRERAELMGGTFDVHSIPGDGFKVRVTVPWPEA